MIKELVKEAIISEAKDIIVEDNIGEIRDIIETTLDDNEDIIKARVLEILKDHIKTDGFKEIVIDNIDESYFDDMIRKEIEDNEDILKPLIKQALRNFIPESEEDDEEDEDEDPDEELEEDPDN